MRAHASMNTRGRWTECISDYNANGFIWLAIKYILDGKNYYCNSRCSEIQRKACSPSDRSARWGKIRRASSPATWSFPRTFEQHNEPVPGKTACFSARSYLINLFYTMQNRERVGDLAPSMNVGPATAMEGRVELVVPCGKAYFESEESLSNFLNKPVSYTCTLFC